MQIPYMFAADVATQTLYIHITFIMIYECE
jgi:hypothetical protein